MTRCVVTAEWSSLDPSVGSKYNLQLFRRSSLTLTGSATPRFPGYQAQALTVGINLPDSEAFWEELCHKTKKRFRLFLWSCIISDFVIKCIFLIYSPSGMPKLTLQNEWNWVERGHYILYCCCCP